MKAKRLIILIPLVCSFVCDAEVHRIAVDAGRAWGANPPADDAKAWTDLTRHADWLGLDWCRVEVERRMYEPRRREFS